MALIDTYAGQRITEMRQALGMSPEDLAADIAEAAATAPWGKRGAVDAWTIRRIESKGHVPGPRVMFVLANYFGMVPHELWDARHAKVAA